MTFLGRDSFHFFFQNFNKFGWGRDEFFRRRAGLQTVFLSGRQSWDSGDPCPQFPPILIHRKSPAEQAEVGVANSRRLEGDDGRELVGGRVEVLVVALRIADHVEQLVRRHLQVHDAVVSRGARRRRRRRVAQLQREREPGERRGRGTRGRERQGTRRVQGRLPPQPTESNPAAERDGTR